MGIKFEIEILDNPSRTYSPGQNLRGILHVWAEKKTSTEGIQVKLKGKARVRWTEEAQEQKSHNMTDERESNNKAAASAGERSQQIHHEGREDYFEYKFYVFGTGTKAENLSVGHHKFPIEFRLPTRLPSSFASSFGRIEYYVKAIMSRTKKDNLKVKVPFIVDGTLDLNAEEGLDKAVVLRKSKNSTLFCFSAGSTSLVLTLKRSGFIPQEPLEFTAEIRNNSNKSILASSAQIIQRIRYLAHEKEVKDTGDLIVLSYPGPGVGRFDTEIWRCSGLIIPQLPPTRLCNCRIIDIQYKLKFEVELPGFATNLRAETPITIGTIPLLSDYPTGKDSSNNKKVKAQAGGRDDLLSSSKVKATDYSPTAPPPLPPSYSEAIQEPSSSSSQYVGQAPRHEAWHGKK